MKIDKLKNLIFNKSLLIVATILGLIVLSSHFNLSDNISHRYDKDTFDNVFSVDKVHALQTPDCNGSGSVDLSDVFLLLKHLAGLKPVTDVMMTNCKSSSGPGLNMLDVIAVYHDVYGGGTPPPPVTPVPQNVNATAVDKDVTVTWDAVAGADSYEVYENDILVDSPTDNNYSNTVTVDYGTTLTYKVRTKIGSDYSEFSHISSVTLVDPNALPTMWFGSGIGEGVYAYSGDSFTTHTINNTTNIVNSITETANGNIWLGFNVGNVNGSESTARLDGINWITDFPYGGHVRDIIEDSDGELWFATSSGVRRYNNGNWSYYGWQQLGMSDALDLYENSDGNIWVGTNGGGAVRYDKNNDTWSNYLSGMMPTSNRYVYSILQDYDGAMWFGTNGGVHKLDASGQWTQYLMGKEIRDIFEDHNNNLWFAINAYQQNEPSIQKYDGMNFYSYFNDRAAYVINEDINNNIWVGLDDGVYKFNGTTWNKRLDGMIKSMWFETI